MICTAIGCLAESTWASERTERARLATEAGWRHWSDGKAPAFVNGAALCPTHLKDPKELKTATTPRGKR